MNYYVNANQNPQFQSSRRNFLKRFSLGLGGIAVSNSLMHKQVFGKNTGSKPNFLFILVDDQRNDTLGCAGHPYIKTPNIDKLAENGTRFFNAFVTTSICMASRANILTGLTTTGHGYKSNPNIHIQPQDVDTSFPVMLRQAGYRTGFFGKEHIKYADGFTSSMDKQYDKWKKITRNPYFKKMSDGSKRHAAEIVGDYSRKFIEDNPDGKPFCLYMSFNISHAEDKDHRPGIGHFPWPAKENGMYEDITPPRPRLDDPKYFNSLPDFLKNSMNRTRWHWRWDTKEKYTVNMRAYYRMLSGMDRVVGSVQESLRKKGLDKNTIVIYAADNGYYMGDRGLAGKWTHFEESLRIPLIIYDPRNKVKSRTIDKMALSTDIPATILDIAGNKVPEKYQGRSLLPLLKNPEAKWRTDFFHEFHYSKIPHYYGVRTERYVYAHYYKNNYEFLHDLKTDPTQLKNYVADPEYKQILEDLRAKKDEYIKNYTRAEITAALKSKNKSGSGKKNKKKKK